MRGRVFGLESGESLEGRGRKGVALGPQPVPDLERGVELSPGLVRTLEPDQGLATGVGQGPFEDRLLAANVDERIRRDLMGHALNRERYGKGANIEHLHRIVGAIAF